MPLQLSWYHCLPPSPTNSSQTCEGTLDCVSGAKSDLTFRMKTCKAACFPLTFDVRLPAHTRTTREMRCFTGTVLVLDHPLILTPEFGPGVIHGMRLTLRPIRLSFEDEERPEEKHDEEPKDLRKPYKEVLKSPFSRRIIKFSALDHQTPTNLKIYDGSTDPDDHITRFVRAANQGEWEMPVWCRMFQQTLDGPARGWFDRLPNGCIDNWTDMREAFVERFALRRKCCKDPTKVSKIIRRANETLLDFKERWTEEMSYIPDVPIDKQISSFMSNSKCPKLARSFSDQVPKTVTEMMKRIDDFVKSEEVIKNTEFSKGEYSEKVTATQFRGSRPPRHSYGNGPPMMDVHHRRDHYQTKLNHLIKDVRQRGNNRGRPTRNNNGRGKVINMVYKNRKDLKRKSPYKQHEERMSVPITFPPVMADNVSDGPLIVEAEVEGYWLIPVGKIELEVQFRRGWLTRKVMMKFTVVRASSPYNVILERTGLQELREISSTVHAMLKFLTPKGIATLYARIEPVYECRWSERKTTKQEATKEKAEEHKAPVPEKEEKILVNPAFPEQAITIGTQFSTKCREQFIRILKDNMDVFAWKPSDMAGVPRRLIRHALNVNNSVPPVAHKRRVLGTEKSKVVTREVEEWVKVGIVRPVRYPTWISNPVLVKVDGTWRMCINFKNLNAACPKDYYPLPEIDLKVEAVMGHPFKPRDILLCEDAFLPEECWRHIPVVLADFINEVPIETKQLEKADVLSKLASVAFNHLTKDVLVEVLKAKSIDAQEVSTIVEEVEDNCMTPIIKCLEEGVWPKDENKAKALRMKISQYVMEDGVLFKKSYLFPMLRCVGPLQANYIIRKVHEGVCGMHTGARSVVAKIMRQGYYWLTMHGDTKEVVEKCDSCLTCRDEPGPNPPKVPKVEESKDKDEDLWKPHNETLDGRAQSWFDHMPSESINNWDELWEGFVERRCCKEPIEATRIIRRANKTLSDIKERWTQEMSFIPDVPVVMQISSFVNNSKCPELARRRGIQKYRVSKGRSPREKHGDPFQGKSTPRQGYGNSNLRAENFRNLRNDQYQPYVPQRSNNHRFDERHQEVYDVGFESLQKQPKEIMATEPQLQLPPCPSTVGTPRKENIDRYCDYHGKKGHYTNDCHMLKKQLKAALESGKLNHIIKDVRQRGSTRGRTVANNRGRCKVINMVWENTNYRKRKTRNAQAEAWMDASITFPSVLPYEVSNDPLIIEAEVEEYLVKRVFVDQG
nr:hypothetical protein [Tanacetum cinerariifolium]